MSTDTLTDRTALDIDAGTTPDAKSKETRRWWNPFTRADRPRTDRPRRAWLGGRRKMMEEMRAEQRRLVETLEKINERLEAGSASPAMEIDPMPVIRGIESISAGQKEISEGLSGLNAHMARAEKTDERLSQAVTSVDKTLAGVRSTQAETASAVNRVGDRIEDITDRFESLFSKMQEAEQQMATDYRKLQARTTLALAGIAFSVVVVLSLFMTAPWG